MSVLLLSYVCALVTFAVVDLAWISIVVAPMFRSALGDALAPTPRMAPAIAFYVLYPIGLVIFAIEPAIISGTAWTAFAYGALFGFFTYATYDLTNYATLRNWTAQITFSDIAYGTVLGAIVSASTFSIVRLI